MSREIRALKGIRVGISLSETEDLASRGYTASGVNRLAVHFATALLAEGASLAFGHDWRSEGVMEAVCRAALDHVEPRDPSRRRNDRGSGGDLDALEPLLNLLAWPDQPRLDSETRDQLAGLVRIRTVPVRSNVSPPSASSGPQRRYARARALTEMRHQLTQACAARVCVGGRMRNSQGRYPGIFEEAIFALEARQPIYLVGLLGGASAALAAVVADGLPAPDSLLVEDDEGIGPHLSVLYRDYAGTPTSLEPHEAECRPVPDTQIDLTRDLGLFRLLGLTGLSRLNGLTAPENRRLAETGLEDEALHLVLTGLARSFGRPDP